MPSYFVDKNGKVWEYDNDRAGQEAGLEKASSDDIRRNNARLEYEQKSLVGKAGDIATSGLQGLAKHAMAPGMALQYAITGDKRALESKRPEDSAFQESVFSPEALARSERHPFTSGLGGAVPTALAAATTGGFGAGPLATGGALFGESLLSGMSQEAVDSVTQQRDFSATAALMNGGADLALSAATLGLGHGFGRLAARRGGRAAGRAGAEAAEAGAESGVRAAAGDAAAEAGIPRRNFIAELDPGEVPEAVGAGRPRRSVGAAGAGPERMPAAEVEHFLRHEDDIVDDMRTVAGGGPGEKGAFQDFNEAFRDVTNNRVKRQDFAAATPTDEATRTALLAERDAIGDQLRSVVDTLRERGAKNKADLLEKHLYALRTSPVEEVTGILDRSKQALDDLHMKAVVDKTDPYGEMLETVNPVVERIRGTLENPKFVGDKIAELQQVRNSAWSDPANGFIRNMQIANETGVNLFKKLERDYHTGDLVMQFDPGAFKRMLALDAHEAKPVLEAWAKVLDSAERMSANVGEAGVQSAGRAAHGRLGDSIQAIREVFTTMDKRLAARGLARPGQELLSRAEQLPGVGTAVKGAKALLGKERVESFVAGRASGHMPLRERSMSRARDALSRLSGPQRGAPGAPLPGPPGGGPPSGPPPSSGVMGMPSAAPSPANDDAGMFGAMGGRGPREAPAAASRPAAEGKIVDFYGKPEADQGAITEAAHVAETLAAGKTIEDFKALPIDPDDAGVQSLKGYDYFRKTGNVEDNLGKSPGGLPQFTLEGDELIMNNGRHRWTAAQELGMDYVVGRIRRMSPDGEEAWSYIGPIRVSPPSPGEPAAGALGGLAGQGGKVAGVGGLVGAGALLASGDAGASELPEQTKARQALAAQLEGQDPDSVAMQLHTAEALARINQRVDSRVKEAVSGLFQLAQDPKAPPPRRSPEARAIDRRARELDVPRAMARFMGRRDDPVEAWQDKRDLLTSVVADPALLASRMAENLGDLPTQQPEIFAQMVGKTMATVEYLHERLPGAAGKSALDPGGFPPSFEELTEFSGHWVGALYPLDSLDDLSTNELLPEQMEAVQALWPEGYARFQAAALEQIHALSQKPGAIPLEALEQIDSALDLDGAGEPVLSSAMAGLIRQAEQSEQQRIQEDAAKAPPPPGPQVSKGHERLASSALGSLHGAGA